MDELLPLLKEFGFPVFAFILMFWLVNTTLKKNTEVLEQLKDAINQTSVRCPYLKLKGGRK